MFSSGRKNQQKPWFVLVFMSGTLYNMKRKVYITGSSVNLFAELQTLSTVVSSVIIHVTLWLNTSGGCLTQQV